MQRFDARIFMTAVRLEAGETAGATFTMGQLHQLLKLPGDVFLVQAYRCILGRDPDMPGMAAYAARSRTWRGRLAIICALYLSPERVILPAWLRTALKFGAQTLKRQG